MKRECLDFPSLVNVELLDVFRGRFAQAPVIHYKDDIIIGLSNQLVCHLGFPRSRQGCHTDMMSGFHVVDYSLLLVRQLHCTWIMVVSSPICNGVSRDWKFPNFQIYLFDFWSNVNNAQV